MDAATKIQTRNGRTLYFDGERFIMNGPTGTHSLAASETCFERLAAHWSGFSGAKNNESFASNLNKAIVKAFLVRSDCENHVIENDWTGKAEAEITSFDFGVDNTAEADVVAHFSPCRDVIGYSVTVDWSGRSGAAGIYSSDFFTCDGWEVMARTARAAAEAHLVAHILETIASAKITLAQIVGAQA